MPLQATSGAASYDAFGGGVPVVPNYIEECFSCFLHTGTGSAQTITNGIDLSTKGGLVWIKGRNNSWSHILQDTNRGVNSSLTTNNTEKAVDSTGIYVTSFNSNGFSIGPNGPVNFNTNTYVSWAFRKQPKFYTQGTYTGTGSVQNITHDLGSIPAFIIVKDTTNDGSAWAIYHTSLGNTKYLQFTTDAAGTSSGYWNNTSPTSTQFTVGTNGNVNQTGATFVYYAFAHDAGGFGLTGTDNVISCGSYTTDGSGNINSGSGVSLGYEPQFIIAKRTDSSTAGSWNMVDNMRGWVATPATTSKYLFANSSGAEGDFGSVFQPTATGFSGVMGGTSATYIYIAIRRGPMKVPTSGTSVYSPLLTSTTDGATNTTGFPVDLQLLSNYQSGSSLNFITSDRLRGVSSSPTETGNFLVTTTTAAESGAYLVTEGWNNTAFLTPSVFAGTVYLTWNFRRAPSFFDEVCYTGTGSANTAFTHNLTVTPELMIVKPRSAATAPNWRVWSPINSTDFNLLQLSTDGAASSSLYSSSNVFPAIPTATTFTVGGSGSIQLNESGQTFVAYLFATCAGVSKVGSYTGTGTTKQVDCGFTGGARFVLIKRTDSTGDWYVWDTARGIVSGNDPYLLLNSTAAEATGTDYIDTYSAGFEISSTAPAAINASGGTFIFLAIA